MGQFYAADAGREVGAVEQTTKKYSKWRLAACVAVAVCTAFIWGNSMLPASGSSQESQRVMAWLAPLLDAFRIPGEIRHTLVRKLAHMSEFGLLGMLWSGVLLRGAAGRALANRICMAGALCLVTALLDETIQLFSPGRGSLVSDVWIDFAGACLGILAALVIRQIRIATKIRKRK